LKDAREEETRRKKWKRTHRLCAVRKRIAHDIYVARHGIIPSEALNAISIDHPRQMTKVNRNDRSRGILV